MIKLYSYFRSSTSYRVRIALNLKELSYETVPVNLLEGAQNDERYKALNPLARVPSLVHDDKVLTQSLAIIEYLDEIAPRPALIHGSAAQKAHIRALAQVIACDIHPVTNLNVLQHLTGALGMPEARKMEWYKHFAVSGLTAFEKMLAGSDMTGNFCAGDMPSVADLCLVPQMYNMRRFAFALDDFPLCRRIEKNCLMVAAFQNAAPECQPDTPDGLDPIHGSQAPLLQK